MIKINLAAKKQSSFATNTKLVNKTGRLSASNLKEFAPSLRRLLLPLVVGVMANYALEDFKQGELGKLDVELGNLETEKNKLIAKVAQTKGYESLKKPLDQDEFTLRTKIDTIKKLVAARDSSHNMFISLSEAMPSEIWLRNFKIQNSEVKILGKSIGFNQISDFMKKLGENIYFEGLDLKSTQQVKDETSGADVVDFELKASRRNSGG